jgi:sugar lactone lactonase YvrE
VCSFSKKGEQEDGSLCGFVFATDTATGDIRRCLIDYGAAENAPSRAKAAMAFPASGHYPPGVRGDVGGLLYVCSGVGRFSASLGLVRKSNQRCAELP